MCIDQQNSYSNKYILQFLNSFPCISYSHSYCSMNNIRVKNVSQRQQLKFIVGCKAADIKNTLCGLMLERKTIQSRLLLCKTINYLGEVTFIKTKQVLDLVNKSHFLKRRIKCISQAFIII